MDTFFEQIVRIKKTAASAVAFAGIWGGAMLITFFALFIKFIGPIIVFVIAGIVYGALKLSALLNVEYEYIVTNNTLDIDKIINKSSRQRLLTMELPTASRLEKYTPAILSGVDLKKVVFACNKDDQNAYLLVCDKEGKGAQYLIFAPNEKMQSAIMESLPRFISNNAFK